MEKYKPLVIKIIIKAKSAIKSLNDKGIIHRDLKPDNFMLRFNNREDFYDICELWDLSLFTPETNFDVILIDVGCGKNLKRPAFQSSFAMGNLAFWSPE